MFNISTVAAAKAPYATLAQDGAIVPGVAGMFIIGNPQGELVTVTAKGWPKDAQSWEPAATGAVVRTVNGKVSLPTVKGVAAVKASEAQASIAARVSTVSGNSHATIDGKAFASILLAVVPVAAGYEKAVISNVLLKFSPGDSVAVATDGYHLVERGMPDVNGATVPDALIDARDAKTLAALLKAEGYPLVKVSYVDDKLTIVAGGVAYFGDDVRATFPPYANVFPTVNESLGITVNVKALMVAIKAATIKGAMYTTLDCGEAGIDLKTAKGDNEVSVGCNADVPEPWRVAVNLAYLKGAVAGLGCDDVVIFPGVSKLSPVVIRPLNGDGRALVMPVNTK